ncbi:MAG: hypothetical protein RLZZ262_1726 [Bacteroidota bacterium]|jgi:ABC-type transporter Mla subunit MlaD
MKTYKLLTYLVFFALNSCTNAPKLKIEFENVAGLEVASPVLIGGKKVGNVTDMKVQPNSKIYVEAELDEPVQLYENAGFFICSTDLFGGKGIAIENGVSSVPLDLEKLQYGQKERSFQMDSLVKLLEYIDDKISNTKLNDSQE